MSKTSRLAFALLPIALLVGCGDDGYDDPPINSNDAFVLPDVQDAAPDVQVLPDRIINPEGPTIQIQQPQPLDVLASGQVTVKALVTDPDGVDSATVRAILPGDLTFTLNRTGQMQDQFAGIVDLRSQASGNLTIIVEASDSLENVNQEQVDVIRDTGPVVDFISPDDGERYAGSVNLVFEVRDPNGVKESSMYARIGQVDLPLVKQDEDANHGDQPQWILYSSEIIFDDAMFDPRLVGQQQVVVGAENIVNSVSSTSTVTFIVDSEGPVIQVTTPQPGQIVGGIVTIEANIQDSAGVLETSVVAVLGHNSVEYEVPLASSGGGGPFVGTFDTSAFPRNWVFPSISVRAADQLNNESEYGFLVALDNTAPICSLDPPASLFLTREASTGGAWECSIPFDPVGAGVPDDLERVPQVFFLRARIEDNGNFAVGLMQQPLSLVDPATTRLYVLDDTSQPLVVDTNGDGYCDEINPALIPSTNPQSTQEVLVLDLDSIGPGISADYRPPSLATQDYLGYTPTLPAGCDQWGVETDAPDALCVAVENDGGSGIPMFGAVFYTISRDEPAIYSLPIVDESSPLFCAGHQFDALANNISEGWTCAAVRAVDNVGNVGISAPLRFFIDYTSDGAPPYNTADAPGCTGTWDPISQVADPSSPCIFDTALQQFRANQVRREE